MFTYCNLKAQCLIPQSHGNFADGAHSADLTILFFTQFRAVRNLIPRPPRPHLHPAPPGRGRGFDAGTSQIFKTR